MIQQIRHYWTRVSRFDQLAAKPFVERRNRMRESAVVPLFFRVLDDLDGNEATYPGMMRNVSPTGANFLCGMSLPEGARLHIGVLSRNGEQAAELAGRVAYCMATETGFSVGFTFDHELNAPTLMVLAGIDPPFSSPENLVLQLGDAQG